MLSIIQINIDNKHTIFVIIKTNTVPNCSHAPLTSSVQLHTPVILCFSLIFYPQQNIPCVFCTMLHPNLHLNLQREPVLHDPTVTPLWPLCSNAAPWKSNSQPDEENTTTEEIHMGRLSSWRLTGWSPWLKVTNFPIDGGSREPPFKADWASVIQAEVIIYYFLSSILATQVHSCCYNWGQTKYYKLLTVLFIIINK